MGILLALIRASIRSQMVYRASFVLWSVGQALTIATELGALWVLFDRFGNIPGWTLAQVAVLCGLVHIAFALAETAGRGFDQFAGQVRTGDFDRLLLRPVSPALLLAGQTFELSRIGRLATGLTALLWGAAHAGIVWSPLTASYVLAVILGGACTFYGVLVLQATLCFWTVESLEIVNAVTYGGIAAAEMPLTLYPKGLRWLFTFVVPIACMNYIPGDLLLGRSSAPGLAWAAPLAGVAFLTASLQVWKLGVGKYASTGS